MLKKALLSSAALALASTVASAAGIHAPAHLPNGAIAVTNSHGIPMGMMLGAQKNAPTHVVMPSATSAIATNWSKSKNAPFISWYSYFVYESSTGSYGEEPAVQFTPAASATTSSVSLGLAVESSSTPSSGRVSIYTDAGGVPGTEIAGKNVTATESWGPCCFPLKAKVAASLTAGTPYWVVTKADNSNYLVWALQDGDFVNAATYAINFGSGWASYSSPWESPDYEVK
ncbi:MAG TPA: choice-of-anchor R domain-containing protein [Rhizomicrobium sp.]|jgi:hypothetical protein|nr:choice-of-anchor R domain-containing protein [Rhizomicrobium sp.]